LDLRIGVLDACPEDLGELINTSKIKMRRGEASPGGVGGRKRGVRSRGKKGQTNEWRKKSGCPNHQKKGGKKTEPTKVSVKQVGENQKGLGGSVRRSKKDVVRAVWVTVGVAGLVKGRKRKGGAGRKLFATLEQDTVIDHVRH